jgi:predicted transcriptional regulator
MNVKEKVLEHEKRREIYEFLKENPGLHMREIQRRLDIPFSTLEYHLDYLEKHEIVDEEEDRRYCRYFAEDLDAFEKKVVSALRQARLREIILMVLSEEICCFKDLVEHLGIAYSSLSTYLSHLVGEGILSRERIGSESCYSVVNEDRVVKALFCYRSSFMDKLVDRVLDSFLDINISSE